MTANIYSVKDLKSGSFSGLYTFVNDGSAVRALTLPQVVKANPVLEAYPADFDLYSLGTLDLDTGELKSDIKFVYHFSEMVKTDEPNS